MTRIYRLRLAFALAALLWPAAAQAAAEDTAFHKAIVAGNVAVVKEFLAKGVNVNASATPYGDYPLRVAINSRKSELVKLFIEKGADVNQADKTNKMTPLMLSASSRLPLDLIQLLLEKGANLNALDIQGWTPFLHAAYYGNVEAAKLFLEKGADPKAVCPGQSGGTAMHEAALGDRVEMLKFLAERGLDKNALNNDGLTPLMVAVAARGGAKMNAVKWLIDAKVDLNVRAAKSGKTALVLAGDEQRAEIVAMLTAAGATASPANTPPAPPAPKAVVAEKPATPVPSASNEAAAARKLAPPAKPGQRVFVDGEGNRQISRMYQDQKHRVSGEKDPFTGLLIYWREQAGFVLSIECVDGVKEGMEIQTSIKTGKPLREEIYRAGKQHGPQRSYYDNGQLKGDHIYQDDKENGLYRNFFPNGQLQIEGYRRNGNSHGQERFFHPNGKLAMDHWSRDGKPHGPSIRYNEDGTVLETSFYENGQWVGNKQVAPAADAPALSGGGAPAAAPPPKVEPQPTPPPAKAAVERIGPPAPAAPSGAAALTKQALAAYTNKQYAQALNLAEQALRADANDEGALIEKGKALRELGRGPEAIALLEQALASRPNSAKLHFTLGFTYGTKTQQPQKAVEHYEATIRLDPTHRAAHNNLGTALLSLDQTARAETVLMKAVELDPKYLLGRRNLGRALLKNGKAALAVAEFEECLRLQPDDASSQKYLQEAKTALAKSKRSAID